MIAACASSPRRWRRCASTRAARTRRPAGARISPRSVSSYRRLVGLFRQALSNGIFIAAQSEQDAERFRSIGASADRTHVVGNIKFDGKHQAYGQTVYLAHVKNGVPEVVATGQIAKP